MSESERRSTQQLFTQAKNIHLSVRTNSTELENKLSFMQAKIQDHSSFLNCGFCTRSRPGVDDSFKRAFKKLSLSQQVHLFWRMCKIIKEIKDKKMVQQEINQKNNSKNPQKQMMDTTIYIKDKKQYKVWTVTRIKASLRSKKIVITDKSIALDMHDFLIRGAKRKQRQCFALQSTNPRQMFQTIKISNQGHSFEQTINFFKLIKRKALQDEIRGLIDPSSQTIRNEEPQTKIVKLTQKKSVKDNGMKMNSISVISPLYQKMMTIKVVNPEYGANSIKLIQRQMLQREHFIRLRDSSYNQIYKGLINQKVLSNIQDLKGYQKIKQNGISSTFYNKKEQKVKKIYKFKDMDIVVFDWMVQELNDFSNFKLWRPKMDRISCLKIFPLQKTKIFHEVYKHANKKFNYVYIRHHFDLPAPGQNGSKFKKNYFYYDQSVVPSISKSYFSISEPIAQISYILWKFTQTKESMNIIVQAKCDHFSTLQNNLKMTEQYLGEIQKLKQHASNYIQKDLDSEILLNTVLFEQQYLQKISQFEELDHDTQFYTVTDNAREQKTNTLISKDSSSNNKLVRKATFSMENKVSIYQDFDVHNQQFLLKFRHPIMPYKKGTPKLVIPKKDHFHWEKEWIINGKGELINTNKQKLQAQNNVLKSVFKRLGKNILSGKSILSISLPVDVFGDESNLSRLCNSYGYAPFFLQHAAQQKNSIQRFKKVMSFAISSTVIYIKMDKPFNPILGQTYHSLIDGCPVYGQQISHHPPISAVFMKGRGYTVYGNLQAKVEMSLNSANGMNDGQMCVSFNHNQQYLKNTVKYTCPAGQVSGLIFGQRTMSIVKTSKFFDEQNLLYCQLFWGKTKKKSQFSNKYIDAVEGQIVKLKANFDKSRWKNIKKQDVQRQIGMINGRWTGAVYFNSELLFDTYKEYPYQIEPYQASLQSDSTKRKDLILRINAVDMEPAQLAKQQLEQIQRRDRKLRAQYQKNKK